MNDKFDELAKGLAQSVTRRGALKKFGLDLAALAVSSLGLVPAHANDFKLGPLLNLSDSDALQICPEDCPGSSRIEQESCVVVNPTNQQNMVVCWIAIGFKANAAAVSMDGGKHWQSQLIPGLSRCTGGSFVGNPDPWLSFGPDGVLYFITGGNDSSAGRHGVLTSKSLDGGSHWLGPVTLWDTTDKRLSPEYPRIAADPTDARLVYAIWSLGQSGNRGSALLTRSTDRGVTWELPRTIYDPSTANNSTLGHLIHVLPNGTLVDT